MAVSANTIWKMTCVLFLVVHSLSVVDVCSVPLMRSTVCGYFVMHLVRGRVRTIVGSGASPNWTGLM